MTERLRCYRGTSKKTYCNSSRNVANQNAWRPLGLTPTRSAIFLLRQAWRRQNTDSSMAGSKAEVPLYVLDLTAVMSSLLGRAAATTRWRRSTLPSVFLRPLAIETMRPPLAVGDDRHDRANLLAGHRNPPGSGRMATTGLLLAATNHPGTDRPCLVAAL